MINKEREARIKVSFTSKEDPQTSYFEIGLWVNSVENNEKKIKHYLRKIYNNLSIDRDIFQQEGDIFIIDTGDAWDFNTKKNKEGKKKHLSISLYLHQNKKTLDFDLKKSKATGLSFVNSKMIRGIIETEKIGEEFKKEVELFFK